MKESLAPTSSQGTLIVMISLILLIAGAITITAATLYYIRDCRLSVSPSMGGEMTFSTVWNIGAMLLLLGLFPTMGLSRWWSLLWIPVFFGLSFPLRTIIERLMCHPYVEEPTGFQKFIRKVESNGKQQ